LYDDTFDIDADGKLNSIAATIYAGDPHCDPAPNTKFESSDSCDVTIRYENKGWVWKKAGATTGADSVTTSPTDEDSRLSQLSPADTQKVLQDVAHLEKICSQNKIYSSFHDCQCLRNKFITERLDKPNRAANNIFYDIRTECVNSKGIIRSLTEECTTGTSIPYTKLKDYSKEARASICACYSQEVSKKYTEKPDPSYSYVADLEFGALNSCLPK
jgi:hypothetical protein